MKNKRRNICKDNSGYSFLFVIFGVIFIAAIGVIALTMASNYYITTNVSKKASEQFYSTESIVQEIRTGLQEYANTTSETAYKKAIETYSASSATTRDDQYSIDFLNGLADKLVGTGTTWDGTTNEMTYVCDVDKIKELTTKPDAVNVAPGKTSISVVLYNKTSTEKKFHLTVKDIYVNYTDDEGYNSKIKTDIVVNVPDYHLSGDATINELKNYVVITDNQLDISNSGGHQVALEASLKGNIYAGTVSTGITSGSSILIGKGSQAKFCSDRIIARQNLNLENGSDLTISNRDDTSQSDLWLLNIILSEGRNSSLFTKLNANVNAYIQDDLRIDDKNSNVTLSGSYYGYSYNKGNTQVTDATSLRSYYSSAILVNGANTTLNTSGLNRLILAGRAFIEKKRSNGGSMENITSDIQMGEALSVKANQVAYMVPEEFLNGSTNPVVDGKKCNVDETALLNSDIGQYLDNNKPITENYYDNNIIYYFLKFKNENNANEYFKKYYSDEGNKTLLEDSQRSYITSWEEPGVNLDNSLYLLAGHILRYYNTKGASELKETEYFDGSGNPHQNLLNDGILKGKEYVSRQMSLLAASGTTEMRLEDESDQSPLVSTKIIDFDKITGTISRSYDGIGDIYFVDGDTSVSATTKKGIIVASGNVEVNENFTGLILAKGKVTVSGKCDAENDIVMIKSILKNVQKDEDIKDIFKEIDKIDSAGAEKVSMSDYVSYKNWSKNDDE